MATTRQYAYYLEGNQVAIVEKDVSFDNNVDSKDYGPGASRQRWESPQATVADGLEVKYVYAPTYRVKSTGNEGTDVHRFIAWGSDGTNLLLFSYGVAAQTDLSSLFAADDWIYIEGSGKLAGVHQVKSVGTSTGILTLKTKSNMRSSYLTTVVDFIAKTSDASGKLLGEATANNLDIERFKDTHASRGVPYVFIADAQDTYNNGIFEVSLSETSGEIDFVNKITIDADGDYTSTGEAVLAETGDTLTMYNVFYEQFTVHENVEVLQDESFELDLPSYLSKALVYYVKAKLAEDAINIEAKEYLMREFKKMVEKHENSRISGLRITSPGSHAIR